MPDTIGGPAFTRTGFTGGTDTYRAELSPGDAVFVRVMHGIDMVSIQRSNNFITTGGAETIVLTMEEFQALVREFSLHI